jgi:hypothetical protein
MSETEPPKPETPPTPAPDPERVKLEASLEEARQRILQAETRAAYAAGAAVAATRQQPPQAGPDPLDVYSKNDLTMSPDEKRAALSAAMQGAARVAEERAYQRASQEAASRQGQMERQFALNSVMASDPEILKPENQSKFGAAVTKVQMEAAQRGEQLDPMQTALRARDEYNRLFKAFGTQRPPFVEGASRPDLAQPLQAQQQITPQSVLEKTYGRKAGEIKPLVDPNDTAAMDQFNLDYVNGKNAPLFKRGLVTGLDNILAQNAKAENA